MCVKENVFFGFTVLSLGSKYLNFKIILEYDNTV